MNFSRSASVPVSRSVDVQREWLAVRAHGHGWYPLSSIALPFAPGRLSRTESV
jgi:hypothetical protein